jgi:hypothetical protein
MSARQNILVVRQVACTFDIANRRPTYILPPRALVRIARTAMHAPHTITLCLWLPLVGAQIEFIGVGMWL